MYYAAMDAIQILIAAKKRREKIKRLYNSGSAARDLAAQFGVTTQRIYAICGKKNGNGKTK